MKPAPALFQNALSLIFAVAIPALAQPTTNADLLATRLEHRVIFPDPLNYISTAPPTDADTQPLWDIVDWVATDPPVQDQLAAFEGFISANPASPWTPSLRANLAAFYRKQGKFSSALAHWEAAWVAVRDQNTPGAKVVGDYVLGNWTELLASLGQVERLSQLLAETSGRKLDGGPWQQRYSSSREAWARMVSHPRESYRCGVIALAAVAKAMDPNGAIMPWLKGELANEEGLSLADLCGLAQKYRLSLVAVRLPPGADPVSPSIVHYQLGHFAAILKQDGNRYLVSDPAFRNPHWVGGDTLKSEGSGCYLVPSAQVPAGAQTLTSAEQMQTIGRGYPNVIDDTVDSFQPIKAGLGLPGWRISEPYLNLWLEAPTVRYPLPGGASCSFDLTFKQRNSRSTSSAFNFGPSWECSWLSYVDYTSEADEINHGWYYLYFSDMYMPSAGVNLYSVDPNSGDGSTYYNFSKFVQGHTHAMVQTTGFNVTLVTGTTISYLQQQSFALGQHRAYVSTLSDPQGRSGTWNYFLTNGVMCLSNVTDFNGTSATLLYATTNAGLVTGIVDPFGRTNLFGYGASGYLTGITNPLSFGPTFTYDSQGAITNLGTPYGNTAFFYTVNTNTGNVVNRSMKVVQPSGETHLYIYRDQSTYLNQTSNVPLLPSSYSTNELPNTGSFTNTFDNTWMDARNSFHWSPRNFVKLSAAFQSSGNFDALTATDYSLACLKHWLRQNTIVDTLSGTLSMQRDPSPDGVQNGQKTWYDYAGKSPTLTTNGSVVTTNWYSGGSSALPKVVAFVLQDGTSRFTFKEYNGLGNLTNQVSTWGVAAGDVLTRTNTFIYSVNQIDLLKVVNSAGECVLSNVWNGLHQVTTNYNGLGEASIGYYQGSSPYLLLGGVAPNGLSTTNYYYSSGAINYLQSKVIPALGITNTYTYTNGLVYTSTDERGLTVTNVYDNLRRLIRTSRPDGTSFAAFTNLSLVSAVDRTGHTNSCGYDSFGRKTWDSDALGRKRFYSYSSGGDLVSTTNTLGNVTTSCFDNLGQCLTVMNDNGRGTTNQINLLGQTTSTTDPLGVSTTNYYNNQRSVVAVSNAMGLVRLLQCDVRDRVTNAVSPSGTSVATTYDLLGRVLTQTNADGSSTGYGYSPNVAGPTSITNQLGRVTRIGYDLAGRVIATTNANNEVVRKSYGVSGELLSLTDGKNQTTTWGYDVYGRQICKTNANGIQVLTFRYDPFGRLTNRWSAARGNTVFAYDAVGNLLTTTFPISPAITFQYDALNRVTNRTDASGTTVYTYDNVGALITEDGPWADDTVTYSYTNDCLLQSFSVIEPNASLWMQSYAYDAANRLRNLTSSAGAFGYQYNNGLNGYASDSPLVQQISIPNSALVTNSFDAVGRLLFTKLINSQGGVLDSHAYSYDPAGEVTNLLRFETGTNTSCVNYQYDAIGQLTSAKATDQGSVPRLQEQFGYSYDAAQNLSSRTNNALAQSFAVDALNQLANINWSGTLTVAGTTTGSATNVTINGTTANRYADNTFAKDGFSAIPGANTFTAVAKDALNRASTNSVTANVASSAGYSYDLDGNLLSDGQLGYVYDDADQLVRVTATNAWKSEIVYDGLGQRRVRTEYSWQIGNWQITSVTRYVYANGLVIQERDGNNLPLVSYTRGPDRGGGIGGLLARTDNATQTHAYFHCDGSGNITTMLDALQGVAARYLYDPYGNVLAASGPLAKLNAYRYASKETHLASGLIYFGFRFYSPMLQRWLNRDPIQEVGGLNMFAYVGNSPPNAVDGLGRNDELLYPIDGQEGTPLGGPLGAVAEEGSPCGYGVMVGGVLQMVEWRKFGDFGVGDEEAVSTGDSANSGYKDVYDYYQEAGNKQAVDDAFVDDVFGQGFSDDQRRDERVFEQDLEAIGGLTGLTQIFEGVNNLASNPGRAVLQIALGAAALATFAMVGPEEAGAEISARVVLAEAGTSAGTRDCIAQVAEHLAGSLGGDGQRLDQLYTLVNAKNIGTWQEATAIIADHTGLTAGSPVAWEVAAPGQYAVFTDGHVVYGFVPEANPNIGSYVFDRSAATVFPGTAPQFNGAIAVPFTKGF
jgi:RHS repeat-associated protein